MRGACPVFSMFCFKKKRYSSPADDGDDSGDAAGGANSLDDGAKPPGPAPAPGPPRQPDIAPPRLVVEPSSDAESLEGRSRSASGTVALEDVRSVSLADGGSGSRPESPAAAAGDAAGPHQVTRVSSLDSGAPPSPVGGAGGSGRSSPKGRKAGARAGGDLASLCVHCVLLETWLRENPPPEARRVRKQNRQARARGPRSSHSSSGSASSSCGDSSDDEESGSSSDSSRRSSDSQADGRPSLAGGESEGFSEGEMFGAPAAVGASVELLTDGDESGRSTPNPSPSSTTSSCGGVAASGAFLQVPIGKPRASSVDVGIYRSVGSSDSSSRRSSLDLLTTPSKPRAASVDVSLPTKERNHYHARANSGQPPSLLDALRAIATSSNKMISRTNLLHPSRSELERKDNRWKTAVDWTDSAINGEHLWYDSPTTNNDMCYLSDGDCNKVGPKKKCATCKIVIHKSCLSALDKMNFRCRPTFREASVRNYRDGMQQQQNIIHHHWVHRRRQDGRCKQCGKSFPQKFPFNNKDVIAIGCTWCKIAYHNKSSCFQMQLFDEHCSLGAHSSLVVPPSWIVKIPKRNSFKSSVRRRRGRNSAKNQRSNQGCPFVIKAVPYSHIRPLLVFINPKSGGNQGVKLFRKFQWLLNSRQVFDLSQGGPKKGLELYKKVPNLRILACGGDGTVGWVLSEIDAMAITPCPPVAVLPLGTGNDLSRMLGWGPGYTDEPVSKILNSVEEGKVTFLDRWTIEVRPNVEAGFKSESVGSNSGSGSGSGSAPPAEEQQGGATSKLPINVFNNYFSLGADAATTLEFHESREANPEKFNSRLRNKMFYAGCGGKDLLKRSWKDLCDHVQLTCDGVDMTPKIRELKLHCLLFLNIEKYSSGTTPWGSPNANTGFDSQRIDDGYIEVVGFTSTSLATLQVGGHGERLYQCRQADLVTTKPIPVQVDGEPCRLRPSIINVRLLNQARVIMKNKRRVSISKDDLSDFTVPSTGIISERLRLQVSVLRMSDYEEFVFNSERLRKAAVPLGIVVVESDSDLHSIRRHVNRLAQDTPLISPRGAAHLSDKWLFLDSTTSERFFRIDKVQEKLHYVTDVASQELFILDLDSSSSQQRDSQPPGGPPPTGEIRFEVTADSEDSARESYTKDDNETTTDGQTCEDAPATVDAAVTLASSSGDVKPLEKLLNMRKDEVVSYRDKSGNSALQIAVVSGQETMMELLLKDTPRTFVDAAHPESGRTSLHMAVEAAHESLCRRLIAARASQSLEDNDGLSPADLAEKLGNEEIKKLFEAETTNL